MSNIKNTLDGVIITRARQSGNSTRQVEAAIKYLFSGYKVFVLDHYKGGLNRVANRFLFDRIIDKLTKEYNLGVLIDSKRIKIDRNNLTLELIKRKKIKDMKEVKVRFWCNAGHTEEELTVQIFNDSGKTDEQQIHEEFLKWLDNNEQCGWEELEG